MTATVADFAIGDRVAVSPTHWLHRAGAPTGVVAKVGRTKVHVRADVNDVVYAVTPRALEVMPS